VGHPPFGTVDTLLAERIVALLNDLYRKDPEAMHDLVEHRVRCNEVLSAHATVPVARPDDGGGGLLGVLGLLNGLCGAWDEQTAPRPHLACFGPICAYYDSDGFLRGFDLSADRLKPAGG
jgi:hypothetical protein